MFRMNFLIRGNDIINDGDDILLDLAKNSFNHIQFL